MCSLPNTVKCLNSSVCIYEQWILDKQNDCGDWSDESKSKMEANLERVYFAYMVF